MENNRPKIATLSDKELAQLLIDSFFKIGRVLKLSLPETKIFLDEVYNYQGLMYVDTFSDAFSRYAAGEIPDTEKLHPQISPMFISRLMKLYMKKCNENKFIAHSVKDKSTALTQEGKYKLFVQFITINKCLPGNPDWVGIYEHLEVLKKLAFPVGWDALSYPAKWRYATNVVCEWAYANYNINDNLIYKTHGEQAHLRGIGSRLGETIWNGEL